MFIAIFIAVKGECESLCSHPTTIEIQDIDLHSCLAFVGLYELELERAIIGITSL